MPTTDENYRVLVLGLDGATFDLIDPWIKEGKLPHLARLIETGSRSDLESTTPPITPCAWTSFMTGKNPGQHGLFDFIEPTSDGKGFRFTNAGSRKADSLWRYLSKCERTVGVVNVPMTFPPEEVNGYLISGLDTPHEDSDFMFPASLKQELRQKGIAYRLELQHLGNMRTDSRRDQQLAGMHELEQVRTETLKYLSETYPADFRMLVFGTTDQVSHHFWHYMDVDHDKHEPAGHEKYKNAIFEVYRNVDDMIGSILQDEDDRTIVMIMSDHGFGPTTNVRIRLNQVLASKGLLTFAKDGVVGKIKRSIGAVADRFLRSLLSSDFKRTLAGRFPQLRVWFEQLDEQKFDWDRTRAYVNEAYRSSPAVWINRQGMTDSEYEKTLLEVEEALRELVDPKTGKPAISNVYRTRDLYSGSCCSKAPDLLVSWWEDGFLLEQSDAHGDPALMVERSTAPLTGGVEFAGSHRLNGIFVMAGGPARQDFSFSGAKIVDIAPTILYLMGLPIPSDMDGRPLLEALDPGYVQRRSPQFSERSDSELENQESEPHEFNDEESELILKRLQALGYVE